MSALQDAIAYVGGLSNPSKMPTQSWSTPAELCPLGSLLRERAGSTCIDCYAMKGCYTFPSTVAAMARRAEVLTRALASPIDLAAWLAAWNVILGHRLRQTKRSLARGKGPGRDDGRYFRWHDSGDVWTLDHFAALAAVAESNPEVTFWLPTRETGIVHRFLDAGGVLPPNFVVRLSVPMQDRAPEGKLLSAMARGCVASSVHTSPEALNAIGATECGAYRNDNHCGDCRACWDPSVELVSYPNH